MMKRSKIVGYLTHHSKKIKVQGQSHLFKNFLKTRLATVMERALEQLILRLFRLSLQTEI
jgi:phosphopantetheine adenylyltransferase